MLDELVLPGWRHAGFRGAPEVELLLRRGRTWCGTIFLAAGDPRALVETAEAGPGSHWFDRLDVNFHPNADRPTYGLVDEDGRLSVREMPSRRR